MCVFVCVLHVLHTFLGVLRERWHEQRQHVTWKNVCCTHNAHKESSYEKKTCNSTPFTVRIRNMAFLNPENSLQ